MNRERWIRALHGTCRRVWVCALGLLSSAVLAQVPDCMPADAPDFTVPKEAVLQSAIVFVHGVHGDARGTWTADGRPPTAWPCLVRSDPATFGRSNVYLAGYRSGMFSANPSLVEAARLLSTELGKATGVFSHAHVTLVAHSMGGLVVARMLTTPGLLSDDHRRRIRLVVFLGTPATATDAANACAVLRVNAQCAEMADAAALDKLWRDWDQLPDRPPSWCMAEGSDMLLPRLWPPSLWQRIVPEDSAARPCRSGGPIEVALGFDHSQLVKPANPASLPHRRLKVAFATCVKPRFVPDLPGDATLAASVADWFRALQERLAVPGGDPTLVLRSVFPSADLWLPRDPGRTVQSIEDLQRTNAGSAANIMRDQAPILFRDAELRWVRTVGVLDTRLADGAMTELIRQLTEAGSLLPTDLALAVRPTSEIQPLILLRPRGAEAPSVDPPYRILGFLVVAPAGDRCPAAAAMAAASPVG